MKKKIILVIIVVLVCLTLGLCIFAFKNSKNPNVEINDNPNINTNINNNQIQNQVEDNKINQVTFVEFSGDKILGNIKFSNIKVGLINKNECEFIAYVENLSDKNIEATNLEIKSFDESGNVKEVFGGIVTSLMPNEKSSFKTLVLADITEASDFELSIIEEE